MENFSLEDDDYGGLFLTQSTQEDKERYGIVKKKVDNGGVVNESASKKSEYNPQFEDISDDNIMDFQPSSVFNTKP